MSAPWTQVLRLRWAPELKFYEQRIFVLRELEARDALAAFHVADHEVEARLGEREALQLRPTGATLSLIGPDARFEMGREALALAVKTLDPLNLFGEWVSLQFLDPIAASFEDAKRTSTEQVVGRLLGSALDYALLVDGYSETIDSDFQVEMGVIEAADAPLRVGRFVGRMRPYDDHLGVPTPSLGRDDYPPVALFSDWNWHPQERDRVGQDIETIYRFWDGAVAESGILLEGFRQNLG